MPLPRFGCTYFRINPENRINITIMNACAERNLNFSSLRSKAILVLGLLNCMLPTGGGGGGGDADIRPEE